MPNNTRKASAVEHELHEITLDILKENKPPVEESASYSTRTTPQLTPTQSELFTDTLDMENGPL